MRMEDITIEAVKRCLESDDIDFESTHDKLCLPIINRLYKKMKIGLRFSEIKVADRLIIDGHHRYVASRLAKIELDRIPWQSTSATITTSWRDIDFIEEDYESPADVEEWNRRDALTNGIPIGVILQAL
jgi:hypothetical protein